MHAKKYGFSQGIVCGEQWSGHLYSKHYDLSECFTLVNGFDIFRTYRNDDFKKFT